MPRTGREDAPCARLSDRLTPSCSFSRAVKTNAHVPAYLLGEKNLPRTSGLHPGGDENEAVGYVRGAAECWAAAPSALAWAGGSWAGKPEALAGDRSDAAASTRVAPQPNSGAYRQVKDFPCLDHCLIEGIDRLSTMISGDGKVQGIAGA
jgi:hypothetical protein